jgi:hypothetical protein
LPVSRSKKQALSGRSLENITYNRAIRRPREGETPMALRQGLGYLGLAAAMLFILAITALPRGF